MSSMLDVATPTGAGQTETPPVAPDSDSLLLSFVRGRDVPCPMCRYNLRDLSRPVCPECNQALVLAVGVARLRFGWFTAALAPCIFSGIAAVLFSCLMIIVALTEGRPPWFFLATAGFGLLSGAGGILLFVFRHSFLRQSQRRQLLFAALIWLVHIAAFVGLIAFVSSL